MMPGGLLSPRQQAISPSSGGIRADRLTNSDGTVEVHYSFSPETPPVHHHHVPSGDINRYTTNTNPGSSSIFHPVANPMSPPPPPSPYGYPPVFPRTNPLTPSIRNYGITRNMYCDDGNAFSFSGVRSPSPAASFFAR